MKIEDRLSVFETNVFYLMLAIVFLGVGMFSQNMNFYLSILITEVIIVAIPSIYFIKRQNLPLKEVFRFNKLGFKNMILIFFITILTYPIAVFFQAIFIGILSMFIELQENPLPDIVSQIPFAWSVVFIGILPGICEEIMFRGTILRAYEKIGIKKAIIISGLLFGMFHFTLINFIGPAVLGIVFGYMVYRTNSIYSSMFAHSLNNIIALSLSRYLMENIDFINEAQIQEPDLAINSYESLMGLLFIGVFILLLIKVVKALLNKLSPVGIEYIDQVEVNENEVVLEEEHMETAYIEEERITSLTYTPIFIAIIMFFVFNFVVLM